MEIRLTAAEELDAIAQRMRALRLAFGPELGREQQNQFADYVGIGHTAWNNYERAKKRLRIEEARKLVAKFGVTLDWIYDGDQRGLRLDLLEKLRPHLEPDRRRA